MTMSRAEVRAHAFDEITRWHDAYVAPESA